MRKQSFAEVSQSSTPSMMILKQYIPLRWVAVEGNAIICSSYQWQSLQEINKDMYSYSNYNLHYSNLEILEIQMLIHNILFISLKCHHGFLQLRGIYPTSFQILGVSFQYYNTWCMKNKTDLYRTYSYKFNKWSLYNSK